jgi:lipoprotein-anchoring transpeptidase ErfK/SrfK
VRIFVRRYGWRAAALPILAAVTVAVLVDGHSAAHVGHGRSSAARVAVDATARPAGHARGGAAVEHAAQARAAAHAPAVMLWQATESTACLHNTAPSFVLVSIQRQHVWVCQRQRQVYSSPATTGASDVAGDATPTGSWVVQGKQRDRYLTGPGYSDYVHYWIPFNGDYGFHDATWQTMPFGASGYPAHGSHGCVHLPMTAVRWLYRWAQIGTTVVTVED